MYESLSYAEKIVELANKENREVTQDEVNRYLLALHRDQEKIMDEST